MLPLLRTNHFPLLRDIACEKWGSWTMVLSEVMCDKHSYGSTLNMFLYRKRATCLATTPVSYFASHEALWMRIYHHGYISADV